jgi:hypothetical protein
MTQRVDPRRDAFHREVEQWARKIGVQPKRVQIQRMTRKWASWSSSGRICFSADLLKESKAFRETVIVHELVHCLVPNHGKLFKSLMRAYLPHWGNRVNEPALEAGRCSLVRAAGTLVAHPSKEVVERSKEK